MPDILTELYEIVEKRKAEREEGSYTVYLLDAGLDKILKKLGEETAETIIAAKNFSCVSDDENAAVTGNGTETGAEIAVATANDKDYCTKREALKNEVGDLLYHLVVLLHELDVEPGEIEALLRERMQKTGNLKESRQTDKDS